MEWLVGVLVGVVVGFAGGAGVVAAVLGARQARAGAAAQAEIGALRAQVGDEQRLADVFRRLSTEQLDRQKEDLLRLADARLGALDQASDVREKAVKDLVEPVQKQLGALGERLGDIERQRARESGDLGRMVGDLAQLTQSLQSETQVLTRAMKDSRARGSWGELQLRRVVELAGMLEHCDFEEQATVQGDGGRLRPDLVVCLPQDKRIVVDAKVPLDRYLEAVAAEDPARQKALLREHAGALAGHVDALRARDYTRHVAGAVDFVVMFVPGDAFLAAAYEARPALFDDAIAKGVFLATPATLIALLKAIAFGWRQERLAEHAEDIASLGHDLYQRMAKFAEHFVKVGRSLQGSVEAYNDAVGSLESRLLVTARQLEQRGVRGPDLPVATTIDLTARHVTAPELLPAEEAAAG